MPEINVIVGPPGTGKTHTLLGEVDRLIASGVSPKAICFVAFTRKAANEARSRACEKFKLTSDELPWFRTLHSLAFHQLGVSKGEVMGLNDYLTIAKKLGLYLTVRGIAEDGTISGLSKGDRLLFMEGQARTLMKPLKKYWEERPNEDIYWYELEQVANTVAEYKRINNKRDFTDIISEFIRIGKCPAVQILIVDEAQDLSPLQWCMVDKLTTTAEHTYVAGDDDQAIFRWAGADVERFINLAGFRIVLPKSFRVPAKIQTVANTVISRVSNRIPKKWAAREDEAGQVEYLTGIEQLTMDTGTWLLLARNSYLLEVYNAYCISMGYVFDSTIGSPIRPGTREAIRVWNLLLKGEQVPVERVKLVYECMSTRDRVAYGAKSRLDRAGDNVLVTHQELVDNYGLLTSAEWVTALNKIPDQEREYFLAAMKRGEQLTRDPRIRISTIHSVKGGEADHVVLQTDMALRTFNEYQQSPDDEHRVWYVGVTRARKSLHIIQPTTDKAYDI